MADGSNDYRLHVDQFQGGNGGSAFKYSAPQWFHNGKRFSTTYRHNDESSTCVHVGVAQCTRVAFGSMIRGTSIQMVYTDPPLHVMRISV